MSDPTPTITRDSEVEYEVVEAADGMGRGVLIDETDGAPNFAMRRFILEPDATVPLHTNAVEHVQYVLAGEYTVTLDGEERTVSHGDSLFIPAGAEHAYHNDGPERGAFICVVPHGDDEIELVE
ncbi:cupin domain-containing protein [Halopenitus persicus]|uniref:Cupin domain-containing protein n=1 Tax=Halopenitus persicus TaxID=1048396 RepID=A0A1H3EFR1_9EURY|nr:cupin domain-containing protein [Halopenitus persicus]QHS17545.1 cupin domain-containing protein [haloarchaeon 3A1-DGR]SDX77457.1 Cupin domain-containing protein [Halopenitus persicus]